MSTLISTYFTSPNDPWSQSVRISEGLLYLRHDGQPTCKALYYPHHPHTPTHRHPPPTHTLTFQFCRAGGGPECVEHSHTQEPVSEHSHKVVGAVGAAQRQTHTQTQGIHLKQALEEGRRWSSMDQCDSWRQLGCKLGKYIEFQIEGS